MELTYNSIKKKPPNMHLHANKGPYNKSKLQHRSVVGFIHKICISLLRCAYCKLGPSKLTPEHSTKTCTQVSHAGTLLLDSLPKLAKAWPSLHLYPCMCIYKPVLTGSLAAHGLVIAWWSADCLLVMGWFLAVHGLVIAQLLAASRPVIGWWYAAYGLLIRWLLAA